MYPVMAEPPVAGVTNATLKLAFPRVTAGVAGAEGVVAGIVDTEATDSVLLPTAFVACAVHVYVLPFVSADTMSGEETLVWLPAAPPSLDVQVAM
jgi:hypothetical protein